MSSNRPPVDGAELFGPNFLTEHDVVRRRQAREKAARQREAPTVPRKVWHDRDMARAIYLTGVGYSHGEVAKMVGSTEQRVGALIRKLGLRSRNVDGHRLVSQLVPVHIHAFVAAAARDAGLGVGAYVVGAGVARALGDQPDALAAVRHVIPGAEPPAAAVDPGPLLGDGDLPPDQAATVDAAILKLYSRPPPSPPRRKTWGSK